jgi:hypothetical protein
MATYFGFSDECGDYSASMTSKQLARHPFYVRSTLLINSDEWKTLSKDFKYLKTQYNIPIAKEVKWAYLWSLKYFKDKGKSIPAEHEVKCFEELGSDKLVSFVEDALQLINNLTEKKIIISYTKNINAPRINEKAMLSMHLQEHMQRIEMQLSKSDSDDLGVLFFDPVNPQKNEHFRELYFELFEQGDYVRYGHIKDSLNIENSHHSVGIQLADYISGAFSAVLKASDSANYSDGVRMYLNSVHPNLRRSFTGTIQGYGIREVPSSSTNRAWLDNQLKYLGTI